MTHRHLLVAFCVGIVLSLCAAPAQAEKSYVIERYDVRVELAEDGSYSVRETLDFDFRGDTFSYAYREIRLRGIAELQNLRVESGDVEILRVEEDESSRSHSLRWEFPPRLGATRFVVSYRAFGALQSTLSRNRIDWDAVGREWDVPIEQVLVTVVLPRSFALSAEDISFEPLEEGTLRAIAREGTATGWEVLFRYGRLDPGTAYRVKVDFPQRLTGREPPRGAPPAKVLWSALAALLIGMIPGLSMIRRFGSPKVAPGDGSRPDISLHEAAALMYPLSPYAERGFVATVFDLARRGHVRLVRRKKGSGWLKSTRTYLEPANAPGVDEQSPFEQELLGRLGRRETLEAFGKKDRSYRRKRAVEIRKDLVRRGWLQDRRAAAGKALVLGLIAIVAGIAMIILVRASFGWLLGALVIGLSFGGLMATTRLMPALEEGARRRASIKAWVERLQDEVADHLALGDESRAAEHWLDSLPWLTIKPKPSLLSKLTRRLKKSDAHLQLPGWARDETGAKVGSAAAAYIAFQPYLETSQSVAGAVAPSSGASSSGGAGAGAGGGAGGGGGGAG